MCTEIVRLSMAFSIDKGIYWVCIVQYARRTSALNNTHSAYILSNLTLF